MMDIDADFFQWFINFLIKETSGRTVKSENVSSKELAEELHKPIIKKFKKRKVQPPFIEHFGDADLADMQLISLKIIKFIF